MGAAGSEQVESLSQLLRLLIVEDSKEDVELLLYALRRGGYEAEYEVVDTPAGMRAALERPGWDVITSDHAMPQFSAPEALALARELRPEVPFIIVSGEIDLNLAVSLLKGGARDYIKKEELTRMAAAIERELREAKLRGERALAVEALQVSESRYRRLFETAQDGILILDAATGQIMDANPFLTEMLGYSREEFFGKRLWEIGPFKDVASSKIAFAELQSKGYIRYEDLPLETGDGQKIAVEFVSNSYLVDHKEVIQCNIRNITDRKRAEAEIIKLNAELEQHVRDGAVQFEALNRKLETLSNSVSHDLHAPLRHVDGCVETLREDYGAKLGAEGLKLIQKISAATQRMHALIDALLEMIKPA